MSETVNQPFPRYPVSYQAVDIVVVNIDKKEILLGRKHNKTEWRFVGGFVDPADSSLEYAARRELAEEAGKNLEVSDPRYVGSFRVDDPRYRGKVDRIMSAVFYTEYVYGLAEGGDDIAEVQWFNLDWFRLNYASILAPEHKPLVELLIYKGYV